jgi:hypothetical protein
MKAFSALVVLRIPPETLFIAMRDRLGEIAPALADIDSIIEVERAHTADGLRVVNRWHARQHVPALLQPRLGSSDIAWIDRAMWFENSLTAQWSIEPSIGHGAIACTGTTCFEPAMAGRGSRALFKGELTIAPKFLASIVGPFEKPVRTLVESIATTLIPANFRAAAEAAARLS